MRRVGTEREGGGQRPQTPPHSRGQCSGSVGNVEKFSGAPMSLSFLFRACPFHLTHTHTHLCTLLPLSSSQPCMLHTTPTTTHTAAVTSEFASSSSLPLATRNRCLEFARATLRSLLLAQRLLCCFRALLCLFAFRHEFFVGLSASPCRLHPLFSALADDHHHGCHHGAAGVCLGLCATPFSPHCRGRRHHTAACACLS